MFHDVVLNLMRTQSKDVVHERETEFAVFPVTDFIDVRKSEFLAKIPLRKPDMPIVQKIVTEVVDILCQHS